MAILSLVLGAAGAIPQTRAVLEAGAEGGGQASQPNVPAGAVLNNASYMLDGLPGDGIARGSMFAVFGSGLGPVAPVQATELPLAAELGGTSVEVTVQGVTRQAFLLVSAAAQLAAVLPSDIPAGEGELVVIYQGLRSQPAPFKVVDSAFGIFSRNQAGFGPGIVQNFVSASEQSVNALIDAAHSGQVAILWGTGLGPIDGDDSGLPPVANLPVDVEVWVGGRMAGVLYAGRSPQFPAIDQVNFTIPEGVTGCYVPVVVVVNGVASNSVTIAVAEEGRYCSDEQIFLPGELETLRQIGIGGFGYFELSRFRGELVTDGGSLPVLVDEFLGAAKRYTADGIAAVLPLREAAAPPGACLTYRTRLGEDGADTRPDDPIGGAALNLGLEIEIEGPSGVRAIPRDNAEYERSLGGGLDDAPLPEFFVAGEYVLRGGSAEADVGPFEARIDLPTDFEWLNRSAVDTVVRGQDLTVQWAGADAEAEYVSIIVQSVNLEDGVAGAIYCSANAATGGFTVPARTLGILPPSSPFDGEGDPTGLMAVTAESKAFAGSFTAPGLIAGRLAYADRRVRSIDVR